MPIPILMPALSPTMTEGNLANWLKKPGERVSPGDIIAEIETDKATMEVESIDEGTLGKILIEAGTEGVAVNTPIAVLLEEGEDEGALEGFDAGGDGAAEAPAAKADKAPATEPPATPAKGYGRPVEGEPAPSPSARANGHAERVFASPLARRIAAQEGLDLGRLEGSGPHGRIVKRDVEAALEGGVGKAAPAAAKAPAEAPVTGRSSRSSSTTCGRRSPSAWSRRSRRSRIST
jgi:pyruvate dehydrogenase E2 component (dihydrolipoamide acetyltransferase)